MICTKHLAMTTNNYTEDFYSSYLQDSRASATQILPIVFDLCSPRSVLDVGCGIGTWLQVAKQLGAETIQGIDGSYLKADQLLISKNEFRAADLSKVSSAERHFELAISMEVAEHLPPSSAMPFVRFLCDSAPVVLFSAAVPFQGGTSHINEHWQSYWASLFEQCNYIAVDCIRPKVWTHPLVSYYYAQNAILYVDRDHLSDYPAILRESGARGTQVASMIHPHRWEEANSAQGFSLSTLLRLLPVVALRTFVRQLRHIIPASAYQRLRRIYLLRYGPKRVY